MDDESKRALNGYAAEVVNAWDRDGRRLMDLARRMGCSTATAKRALAELRSRKLIEVADRGRLGGGPSSYRILEAASHDTADHGLRSAPH